MSNIISGIFLAVFQPFKLGDYVEFKGEGGHIEDITLRHTVINTWDGRHIFVPNNIMNNESIINWTIITSEFIWPIEIKIPYNADVKKAQRIMLEVAESHPKVIDIQDMAVKVPEIGNSAVKMRLLIGVESNDVIYSTGSEIRENIRRNFEEEGIDML